MDNSNPVPDTVSDSIAFPQLTGDDLALLKPLAIPCSFEDGQTVFSAGSADLDLFVVESGAIEILNPSNENRHVVTHGPGQFAGDIDLLTRRPVIVTGVARGRTRLMRVPGGRLRVEQTAASQRDHANSRSGTAPSSDANGCHWTESSRSG